MADVWIGIDLGTSSVKCLGLNAQGEVVGSTQHHYPVHRPRPGWAEQDPQEWWTAVCTATAALIAHLRGASIRGVGLAGQMHGLVLVNHRHQPCRPAIIWSDGRAHEEVEYWRETLGDDKVEALTGFRSASGMAGLSLTWLNRHDRTAVAEAAYAMQPKDYIRLYLTGAAAVEPTDAGASLLFDLQSLSPASELLEAAGAESTLIPPLVPTLAIAGSVTHQAAEQTGLTAGTPVAAGGGDQAMTALALGLQPAAGRAAVTLSSGGTVLVPVSGDEDVPPGYHRLQGPHPGSRIAMGVVLAAGLATDWLGKTLSASTATLLEEAAGVEMDEALIALPHLGGTRTPRVASQPQGAFAGLGFRHTPAHLMRAVVEGVAVSLAEDLKAIQRPGAEPFEIVMAGGGARFPVWRQAVADATGTAVVQSSDLEHAGLGAALAVAVALESKVDFVPQRRVLSKVEPHEPSTGRLEASRSSRSALANACVRTRPNEVNYA